MFDLSKNRIPESNLQLGLDLVFVCDFQTSGLPRLLMFLGLLECLQRIKKTINSTDLFFRPFVVLCLMGLPAIQMSNSLFC